MKHQVGFKFQDLPPVQKLMVEYLAASVFKNLQEVDWEPVAVQLHLESRDFVEMVESFGEEILGKLWLLAVNRRIESLSAAKPLQNSSESRIRSKALIALEGMLDNKMVKDVNELLSIAAAIQKNDRANQPALPNAGVVINNFGASGQNPVIFGAGQTLPSGEQMMVLDLSPHTLRALQNTKPEEQKTHRVIDSDMLGVDDLPLALNQLEADEINS